MAVKKKTKAKPANFGAKTPTEVKEAKKGKTISKNIKRRETAAAVAVCAMAGSAWAAVELPALQLDKTQTTVSGLSSGGYMAVQLHVAFSSVFAKGAGVEVSDVNRLIKNFLETQKVMKQLQKMGKNGKLRGLFGI